MSKSAYDAHLDAKDQERFGLIVAAFMKQYRPDDQYEAFDFERNFMNVVAEIYRQAQAPFVHEFNTYRNAILESSSLMTSLKK